MEEHAAAQDGGQELEGKPAAVPVGQAGEGQGQMVLLDGFFLHGDAGGVYRRFGLGQPAGRHGGEAGRQVVHIPLGKAARQGHHDVPGQVVGGHVRLQPGTGHLLQGGLPAQDGPGQGGAVVHPGGQPLGAQVLRVVLIHADLLQHHAPLGLHILLGELGGEKHVAQDVCRLGQVGVQHPGVEAGGLLGGVGVDLAPHRVHLSGQVGGGAAGGALEEHVLDKVGCAVLRRLLLAAAGAHIDAQGRRADGGDVLCEDAHAVGQGYFFICQSWKAS